MRTVTLVLVLLAVVLPITTSANLAHATIADPAKAESAAQDALGAEDMTFCKSPKLPLSPRAKELCASAADLPNCEGFKAACDAALAPKKMEPKSDWLEGFGKALGWVAQVLVYLLVAGVLVAIAIPIVNAIRKRRRDARLNEVPDVATVASVVHVPVGEAERVDDAEAALRRADELAERGELTRATSLYLAASLAALDRRGAIRLQKSRTNGEYVRACSEPERKPMLRGIVSEVDRVEFGKEPPTTERVGKVARFARALVRALPLGVLLVLGLAMLGCGTKMPSGLRAHDDPAGDDLFTQVLERQGFKVSRVPSSLASLRDVPEGKTGPILVVDLERTPLEPDAETRLLGWAANGGVLVLFGTDATELAKTLELKRGASSSTKLEGSLTPLDPVLLDSDDEDDDDFDARLEAARKKAVLRFPGSVLHPSAVEMPGATTLVTDGEGHAFALAKAHGKGAIVVAADGELLQNVVLARKGNPTLVAALFTELSADPPVQARDGSLHRTRIERDVYVTRPEDGISPPSNPFSALARAGLEKGLWHALAASFLLFLAYGIRLSRPRPEVPPGRRAFAEHVEATGAFYARTPQPAHALAAFTKFAEERLRASLPRGSHEVAPFLAARSGRSLEDCEKLWTRASSARPEDETKGDELATLRELRAVVTAALRRDTTTAIHRARDAGASVDPKTQRTPT